MECAHSMDSNFASARALLDQAARAFGGGGAPTFAFLQMKLQGVYAGYMTNTAPARLKMHDVRTQHEAQEALRTAVLSRDYQGEILAILRSANRELLALKAGGGKGKGKGKGGGKGKGKGGKGDVEGLLEVAAHVTRQVRGIQSRNDAQAAREAADAAAQAVTAIDVDRCTHCDVALVLEVGRSESRCPECHRLYEIQGVAYEEAQIHSQEGHRTKTSQFSPNRHCTKWLNHILALELVTEIGNPDDPEDISGEKLVRRLLSEADRLNIWRPRLDVATVRSLLKTIGRTDLNQNVSLLLKKMVGLEPPSLSERKRTRTELMFAQVIQTLADGAADGNRKYYPYYLYKILDLILEPDDSDRFILWFIHLQGAETLRNNDHEWKDVCEKLEWEWRATDPEQASRYRELYGVIR